VCGDVFVLVEYPVDVFASVDLAWVGSVLFFFVRCLVRVRSRAFGIVFCLFQRVLGVVFGA